jgi:hypothetical protein
MSGRDVHRGSTLVLSLLMALIGLALIVQALSGSAGPLSSRMLLGLLFLAAGAGRIYIVLRRERERST